MTTPSSDTVVTASSEPVAPSTAHAPKKRRGLAVILLVCLALVAAWYLFVPTRYTGSALIDIGDRPPYLLPDDQANRYGREDFDVYRNTQVELIKSRLVLERALGMVDPALGSIDRLSLIREQIDPIDWLSRHLKVDFPSSGSVMRVSLAGTDPGDTVAVINAIAKAYIQGANDYQEARL